MIKINEDQFDDSLQQSYQIEKSDAQSENVARRPQSWTDYQGQHQ